MKEFITDSDIIENIFNQVLSSSSKEELTSNSILTVLPKIIVFMETQYKLLLGSTKKQLVTSLVERLLQHSNCTAEEVENIKLLLPELIDSLVVTFNSTSKLFRKNKKCCLFPKKVTKRK